MEQPDGKTVLHLLVFVVVVLFLERKEGRERGEEKHGCERDTLIDCFPHALTGLGRRIMIEPKTTAYNWQPR